MLQPDGKGHVCNYSKRHAGVASALPQRMITLMYMKLPLLIMAYLA